MSTEQKESTLPEWAVGHFPQTVEQAQSWVPHRTRCALASRVLAVARTRREGAWNAYVDAVPGVNHDHEEGAVFDYGDKLDERLALAIFPRFEGIPYAR